MVIIKRFVIMLQFLTTIPVPVQIKADAEDFGKALVFAPVVGLCAGGILAGASLALGIIFSPAVTAALLIVLYILLTGGLHLDGLGDTFDGLFSNRPREKILEIMRDSRVGTNAVLAIFSVLLLDWVLMSALDGRQFLVAVLLMPVAGRIGSLAGAAFSTYARSGEGLGKSFIDYCGIKEFAAGLILYGIVFYLAGLILYGTAFFNAGGSYWMMISIVPVISAYLLIKLFSTRIGGATGDILGAVCEINQTIFLVVVLIADKVGFFPK